PSRSPPSPTLFPYTTLFRSHSPPPRRSESVAQESAVHGDAFAGDVTGRRQAQETHRRRHFLRFPDPAHRRARDHFLVIVRIRKRDRKSTRLNSSHVKISYAV